MGGKKGDLVCRGATLPSHVGQPMTYQRQPRPHPSPSFAIPRVGPNPGRPCTRAQATDGTVSFDMNGVRVQATVVGTTGLSASMSQIQKAQGNTFQVFLDGVLQPASRFNTSTKKSMTHS